MDNCIIAKRKATNFEAFLAMIVMLLLLSVGSVLLGMDLKMMFLFSIICNMIICWRCRLTMSDMKEAASSMVADMVPFLLILLGIGLLVAGLMMSGTIPVLVAWLSGMINAKFVVLLCFVFTGILAIIIGSAFATVGTMGVIMMGVATLLDANIVMSAGACLSGSLLGQYLSPIADITNLGSSVSNIPIMRFIKDYLPVMSVSIVLSAVLYLIFGRGVEASADAMANTTVFIEAVNNNFQANLLTLLPIILLIVLSILRCDALVVIYATGLFSMLLGVVIQGFSLTHCINACYSGFSSSTMMPDAELPGVLQTLLNRGGIYSMADTIVFVILIMTCVSLLRAMGALDILRTAFFRSVKGAGNLALVTSAFSFVLGVITCEPYVNVIVTTEVATPSYIKAGYDPRKIATVCNSTALLTGFLLPWGFCAIYVSTVLGVTPLQIAPVAFLPLIVPIVSVIFAYIGIYTPKLQTQNTDIE